MRKQVESQSRGCQSVFCRDKEYEAARSSVRECKKATKEKKMQKRESGRDEEVQSCENAI